MRRRDFLSVLGSAAAVWPFAARAQQAAMPVIGFIHPTTADTVVDRMRGFHRGLKEAGYVEGENLTILYRWAENQFDRLPALAADLVQRKVAVIVTSGGAPTAFAAKMATTKIPVVFTIAVDPVGLGLVTSLSRPDGNLTGINFFSAELVAKRMEFLRQFVPAATRVTVLVNPTGPTPKSTARDAEIAGRAMGLQVQIRTASTSAEINAAFASFERERTGALFVGSDPFFTTRRIQLVQLAAHHSIPATYSSREIADVGGLMSYGSDVADALRQVGAYAGRILKGAKPADLPVVQASKFELVINAETARMLGLVVPPSLLAIADQVIE